MKLFAKIDPALKYLEEQEGILFAKDLDYADNPGAKEFVVFNNYDQIEKELVSKDPKHLYEVFYKTKKCNFFMDCDITDKEGREDNKKRIDEIVSTVSINLKKYCLNQQIDITNINPIILKSPSTEKKDSYHIIFRMKSGSSNVYFDDILICKNFYEYITKNEKVVLTGVDSSVYTKNRSFRILNSSKRKFPENKLMKLDKTVDDLQTLATYTPEKADNKILHKIIIKTATKKEKINIDNEIIEDESIIKKLLNCIDKKFATEYNYWNKLGILLYCIKNGDASGLDLWSEFVKSKNKEAWDHSEMEKYWENYKNLEYKSYSIGSLYYWAKNSNPSEYEKIFEKDFMYCLSMSTESVAKAFRRRYSNKFFKQENGNWYEYNDITGIWRTVPNSLSSLYKYISMMADDFTKYKDKVDKEEVKKMIDALVSKIRNISFKKQIICELEWIMEVSIKNVNNNDFVLPFTNGVYDLENNCFRAGYYEEYITITTGYDYKEVDTNLAIQFMKEIFLDEQVYKFVLNTLSSSLDNKRWTEAFYIWFNRLGSNGKSLVLEILKLCLGNFCTSVPVQLILLDSQNAEAASPSLMLLKDKRLVYFQEPPKEKTFSSSVIKRLTGGDEITGRNLHSNIEKFYFNGIMITCCNDKTRFDSVDGGVERRLFPIKFKTHFVKNPIKPNERQLKEIDKNALKLPMINLLIKNYSNFKASLKEKIPQFILDERKMYLDESDTVMKFIDENIEEARNGYILKRDIKRYYKDEKENYDLPKKYTMFINDFEARLDRTFLRDKKINGVKLKDVLIGYKLKDVEEDFIIEED